MKLKELSRLLNLSATTVSRAINGYPEVNAETRARVLAAARKYGYVPNQMARRLATGRTMAIGHVVSLDARQTINPIFAEFILGAGETYSASGYDMVLSIVPASGEMEAYDALARHNKVDGFMIHGPYRQDPRIDLVQSIGLPFLMHGRDDRAEDSYSWLDINNRQAFRDATDHLLDLGHRRIALLNGFENMTFAYRRRLGFEEAFAARGLKADPDLMRNAEMIESFGHAAVREMMARPDPPTAFLVSAITIGLGALRGVRELGLAPGRDVSIMIHDDELAFLSNTGDPPLFTAMRSSIRAAGRRSAEMLIALIDTPGIAPIHELWEATLVRGVSTGPNPREARS